jgi:hypothetical protein
MKNKSTIVVFLFALLCTNCNIKKEQPSIEIETEKIDFYSFELIEEDSYASIIKEKKYVLLDNSNDDFLFKGIDKIKFANERIYVLDNRLKKLIVFNQDGVGIGRVGRWGQGPGEYLQISDFDVNDSGDIYFIDGTADKDRLFVFDKNLHFISVKKMPFEADIVSCLSDNKVLFGLTSWNNGENASQKIAITDTELKTEQSYMPYDEYVDNAYWISSYTFVNIEDKILYNKQIDNFVYSFSKEGAPVKAYLFDFGKKNVPDKDKKNIEENLNKFEHYCCLKNFVIINEKYIIGTLWDELKTKTFIIDRNDKKRYMSKEIASSDESNISGYYNNQIISYIYPGKYEDIQSMDFPLDVKKHIEEENFVICLQELK